MTDGQMGMEVHALKVSMVIKYTSTNVCIDWQWFLYIKNA